MTRKDYDLLAGAFRRAGDSIAPIYSAQYTEGVNFGISQAVDFVAAVLAVDNPRFDRDRFLTAVRSNDNQEEVPA